MSPDVATMVRSFLAFFWGEARAPGQEEEFGCGCMSLQNGAMQRGKSLVVQLPRVDPFVFVQEELDGVGLAVERGDGDDVLAMRVERMDVDARVAGEDPYHLHRMHGRVGEGTELPVRIVLVGVETSVFQQEPQRRDIIERDCVQYNGNGMLFCKKCFGHDALVLQDAGQGSVADGHLKRTFVVQIFGIKIDA